MKIGIIGVGAIGSTLARKLSANGHVVTVANSRGPETVGGDILAFGAKPGTIKDAVQGKDVLIVSIPFIGISAIAPLIKQHIENDTIIIDTGNYYPVRDGIIEAVENGTPESVWVSEQLGRPVIKAWNAIAAPILKGKGYPAGLPGRIAIPVAGDKDEDKRVAMELVDLTGFDAIDAGTIAKSWCFQPGQPAYATVLTAQELKKALASPHTTTAPQRREEFIVTMTKLGWPDDIDAITNISRYINTKG